MGEIPYLGRQYEPSGNSGELKEREIMSEYEEWVKRLVAHIADLERRLAEAQAENERYRKALVQLYNALDAQCCEEQPIAWSLRDIAEEALKGGGK